MSSPIDISQLTFAELRDYALSLEEDLQEITETWVPMCKDRDGNIMHIGELVHSAESTHEDPYGHVVRGYSDCGCVLLEDADGDITKYDTLFIDESRKYRVAKYEQ